MSMVVASGIDEDEGRGGYSFEGGMARVVFL